MVTFALMASLNSVLHDGRPKDRDISSRSPKLPESFHLKFSFKGKNQESEII